MRASAWGCCAALGVLLSAAVAANPEYASARAWSDPSTLGACGASAGPQVAFPSQSPSLRSGPGAIVWMAGRCGAHPAGSERAAQDLSVAVIGRFDHAALASRQPLAVWPGAELQAVGTSLGRVAVATQVRVPAVAAGGAVTGGAAAGGAAAVAQGRAARPFPPATLFAARPPLLALTRAYLGDAAIVTVVPGRALAVRVQRYFSPTFGPPRLIPIHGAPVTALTATMDYRSDVLVVWQQGGAIYAHMLRASGRHDPTQRIGPSAPNPRLQALVSDNDHGMIAWASTEAASRSRANTRVYIDLSAAGVSFGAPQLLASFADPQRVCASARCLGLVRLSTENVMMAWTAAERGHYVIRAAPAVFAATRPTTRMSDPRGQAVLADLAAGAASEAIALWESTPGQSGRFDGRRPELWAARAYLRRHDRLRFGAPEMIAPAGPNAAPSVAVDPANDRAVAAWLTTKAQGRIEYAVGFGAGRYSRRTRMAVGAPGHGTHWLRITLAVGAGALAVALVGLALRRRSRREG